MKHGGHPPKNVRLAQVAAALVLAAAMAASCSPDNEAVTTLLPDAGDDAALAEPVACPAETPSEGAQCRLPEGTACDFGRCGTRLAQCSHGVWRFGGNAPPSPPCPLAPPDPEAPCPTCWPVETVCRYGSLDCSSADASTNSTVAFCPNGKWVLDFRPCRDGGGPDVQGDGGPDAG